METTYFDAISPLDGRYREKLSDIRKIFSESALMQARCQVEIYHCLKLDAIFSPLNETQQAKAYLLLNSFDENHFKQIKKIESNINHDVKAVEIFLREKLDLDNPNRVHFGLTSEDVNNLAWSTLFKNFKNSVHIPKLKSLASLLLSICKNWKLSPFPARTHGQLATPTTAGKEIAVYINRLNNPIKSIIDHKFTGKLNGATGTYAAMKFAAPKFNWFEHERKVLQELDIERNMATTQIDDNSSLCQYLDYIRTINNILIDLCQDIWMYISYNYLVQKTIINEVGSSTMPHKVNPINFENAEGNLQLSNALLSFMTDKLSKSRMQRDLSGSTVIRNVGVALSHHYLSLLQLEEGLNKISLNKDFCIKELDSHPELLGEAIQTLLRTNSNKDVYSEIKNITKGDKLDTSLLNGYLYKNNLEHLTVSNYLGHCGAICDEVINYTIYLLKINNIGEK
jgi:adenylosuccinate lyase